MTQVADVKKYLDRGMKITAAKAWRDWGIARLAARIKDLRDDGYPVITHIRVVTTQRGTAKIAEYVKGSA